MSKLFGTRTDVTASVHRIGFALSPNEVDAFAQEAPAPANEQPHYSEMVTLSDQTGPERLAD